MNDDQQNRLLGFLSFLTTPNKDGHLAALLVTNLQGTPQEFRCSHPVKPTAIQRPLYGDTLKPYIAVDLCGVPLIKSVQKSPSLILVQQAILLDIRPHIDCPVVFPRRVGEAIDIQTSNSSAPLPERGQLNSTTGKFQPITWECHPDHDEDDKDFADQLLQEASQYLDPLEPFGRIVKAMQAIGQRDERFQ